MKAPPVRGLIETSLVHFPGRISTVIYVGGCTLRCPTCPAPHLVSWGEDGRSIPLDSVLDVIYRRRRWIEAAVVKGGEPFAHPELGDFLDLLKDFGLEVRVDTNGTRPDAMAALVRRELVDYVSMDVKAPLTERYRAAAGGDVDLGALWESIEFLLSGKVDYEFATAVRESPAAEEEVLSIARTIRGAERYVLRPAGPRRPSRAFLVELAGRAARHVKACRVAGCAGPEDAEVATAGGGSGRA